MKIAFILLAIVFLIGCEDTPVNIDQIVDQSITSADVTQANASSSDTTVAPPKDNVEVIPAKTGPNTSNIAKPRISLYWENTTEKHDERKPWSDAISINIDKYFANYDIAKDTTRFCPKYKSLTKDQKKKAIGEFFVALSYYESGFNPKSESVDVGSKNDKGSWSVGLYQMSGNDGAAKALGVDYLGLKDPIKNINVAMYQMNTQIKNTGLFILPNSSKYRYWAIILEGNKYNKVSDVIARVQKHAAFCK